MSVNMFKYVGAVALAILLSGCQPNTQKESSQKEEKGAVATDAVHFQIVDCLNMI